MIGVTLIFMLIEILAGFWSNSLALVSDGFHMLSDVGAMILSLFAIWISKRPSTSTMRHAQPFERARHKPAAANS